MYIYTTVKFANWELVDLRFRVGMAITVLDYISKEIKLPDFTAKIKRFSR